MPSNTPNLNLYKKNETEKKDTFNITTMLNENWDKVDLSVFSKLGKKEKAADSDKLNGQLASYYTNIVARLGYTPLNSTSYTASDVRTKLKTVDGSGSGIDSDLLDGQHGSYYADIVARLGYTPLSTAGTAANSTKLNNQLASYYTNIVARLGYTPLNATGKAADSSKLAGKVASTSPTANTIALRNSSGYLESIIFKQSFSSLNASIGNIMTQVSSADGYFRPSSPAQVRDALDVFHQGNYGMPVSTTVSSTLSKATYNNKVATCSNTGTIVKTVPANVFSAGNIVNFIKLNGAVTFAPGSGMTLYSAPDNTKRSMKDKYSMVTLYFISPTVAVLVGSLE